MISQVSLTQVFSQSFSYDIYEKEKNKYGRRESHPENENFVLRQEI